MPILEFESSAAKGPAPKKPLKLVLGAGVLVGALALGSTLAASINLSGGGPIEFGQGVVTTTACDPDITVTPFSTFINATGGGEHKLTSIRLSGIDSSDGACEGKTFRIRAYGDGPDPLDLFEWEEREYLGDNQYSSWTRTEDPFDYVDITRTAPDFLWTSGGTDDDDVIDIDDETNIQQTAFTLNLVSGEPTIRRTALALAEDVKKITVETFAAVAATQSEYITTCNTESVFEIGELTEVGYVFLTPNCPDNPTDRYFFVLSGASWADFNNGNPPVSPWCDDDTYHGINGVNVGSGYANTSAWLSTPSCMSSGVVTALNNLRVESGLDFFIPSKNEMLKIYENLSEVDEMGWHIPVGFWYWTSSEYDSNQMWMLNSQGLPYPYTNMLDFKTNTSRIIPVISIDQEDL